MLARAAAYDATCIDKRVSQSKPDRGIVVLHDVLDNRAGEIVLTQKVTLLVQRRA